MQLPVCANQIVGHHRKRLKSVIGHLFSPQNYFFCTPQGLAGSSGAKLSSMASCLTNAKSNLNAHLAVSITCTFYCFEFCLLFA
jgi:hypothetical protein